METFGPHEPFKFDSKGLCILCLRPETVSSDQSKLSVKLLFRYLKIDLYNLCNFSPEFLSSMDTIEDGGADVDVSLCASCDFVTSKFAALYQEMEMIRLQMDYSLQTVHDAVLKSSKDFVRATEYRRRLRSRNMFQMINANLVEKLRTETMQKCSERMNSMMPRVYERVITTAFKDTPSSVPVPPPPPASEIPITKPRRKPPGPKSKTAISDNGSKLTELLTKPSSFQSGMPSLPSTSSSSQAVMEIIQDHPPRSRPEIRQGTPTRSEKHSEMEMSPRFLMKLEPEVKLTVPSSSSTKEGISNSSGSKQDRQGADAVAETPRNSGTFNSVPQLEDILLGDAAGESERTRLVNVHPCPYCEKVFHGAQQLNGHLSKHKLLRRQLANNAKANSGNKRYKCRLCARFFYAYPNYKNHLKSHGAAGLSILRENAKPKHQGGGSSRTYKCTLCLKVFNTWNIRRIHQRAKHPMTIIGNLLPPGTSEEELSKAIKVAAASYVKVQDEKKPYGCNYCSYPSTYPHPSHYRLHILTKHIDTLVEIILRNKAMGNGIDYGVENNNDSNVEILLEQEPSGFTDIEEDEDLRQQMLEDDEQAELEQSPILISTPFSLSTGAKT